MEINLLQRPRRLRSSAALRALVAETAVSRTDLCLPLFIREGPGRQKIPITAMPGVAQWTVETLRGEASTLSDAGVKGLLLFGIPDEKDEQATEAWKEDGIIPRAIRAVKRENPDLLVFTDVCLCEYMSHGHCGIVQNGKILNDPSLELLAKTAVAHAHSGADVVAPSDMMDGRVAAIRAALDASGHSDTPILSYAAKYASAFYGPFREAAQSAPQFGDRRTYQMDSSNRREAMREIDLDLAEGADMIMVKPAGSYLDILREARDRVDVPLAAYQVSGEYAMIKAAAANGWLDERAAALESLSCIKRAGADFIFTYYAAEAAQWLRE